MCVCVKFQPDVGSLSAGGISQQLTHSDIPEVKQLSEENVEFFEFVHLFPLQLAKL